jgi:multiple sugar transport system permease protein
MMFYVVPFFGSIQYVFIDGANGYNFSFSNFVSLIQSNLFLIAIKNTGIFILCNVTVVVVLSFIMANIIRSSSRMGKFLVGSMVLTYMLPVAALVTVWSLLFDTGGVVNQFLHIFGIERIDWLKGDNMLRWPVILLYIWKNTGFNMIIMMAGLSSIDKSTIEASMVDGAGWYKRQFYIILPQMVPTIFFVTVLSTVNALKIFKEAYMFGGAYPETSIYTIQHFINNQFFQYNYSLVVTSSLIFAIIIYFVVLILFRVDKNSRRNMI